MGALRRMLLFRSDRPRLALELKAFVSQTLPAGAPMLFN